MYGYTMHIPAPPESYQALHQAVMQVMDEEGGGEGLIVHVAYPTDTGFDLIEVWETKEQLDVFNQTVMPKAMERSGVPMDGPPPDLDEFDPMGVVTPLVFSSDTPA